MSRRSTSSSVASLASSLPGVVDVNEAARVVMPRVSSADLRSSSQADGRPKVRGIRDEPRQDHDPRSSHERLGHREQRVEVRLVGDGNQNRSLRGPPGTGKPRRVDIQRWVLLEDGPLQLLERRARIYPELVHECPTRILVGVQRLRLPARPVERGHHRPPQALAKRVLDDQCLELSNQLVVAPERKVGVDPELYCREPDLVEPADGRLGEALVGKVRERRASPQRQRLA